MFHNRDDHAKNFSYLLDQEKNWKLAPAYDLTYSIGPGGEHQMDICGEGKNPNRSHLLKLAEKSGLKRTTCEAILDEVIEVAHQFKQESKHHPIRTKTLNQILQAILNQTKRLTV